MILLDRLVGGQADGEVHEEVVSEPQPSTSPRCQLHSPSTMMMINIKSSAKNKKFGLWFISVLSIMQMTDYCTTIFGTLNSGEEAPDFIIVMGQCKLRSTDISDTTILILNSYGDDEIT